MTGKRRRQRRTGGSIVRYMRGGRAKRVRCQTQWSEEVEALFLDTLFATCNVQLSAKTAGVGPTSAYRQRRKRSDFAGKWQAALEQGYVRLEMALVAAAADSMEEIEFDADRQIPKMSAETALKVLSAHRAAVTGIGRRPGWQQSPRPIAYYRDAIQKKIDAIRAARALPPPEEDEPGAA